MATKESNPVYSHNDTSKVNMSDADWKKLHPIPQLKMLPTVGHAIHFMMLTHESTHLGQLATWRHAQGLPMALSKLSA